MRKAVVTGATAGIGLAIAHDLLARGHDVFICGRDPNRMKSAISELTASFGAERVDGQLCDVRDAASVEAMINRAGERFSGIDILVNNAGVAFVKPFEALTSDMWNEMIGTNLTGAFNCARAVLPWLRQADLSDIVNMGSRSGRYAYAGGVGYNTTKFGLQGFTEALFLDLSRYGVRVSLVAPGTVATGLGGTEPKDWHLLPEDVAKVVGDVIAASRRTAINWVELRPACPQ